MSTRPLPEPTSDSLPFWTACRQGRLAMPRCTSCGRMQFYPRRYCTECMSELMTWEPVSGRGSVYSYTTTYRALSPAFKDLVPYVVAAVDLDEGPRLMTHLVECAIEDVRVGMPVAVTFLRLSDEIALPVFRPVRTQA